MQAPEMKFLYLSIDIGSALVPLLFSFHPKINFYKTWKAFFPAAFIAACIFLAWDNVFTDQGVWGFNNSYVTGIYIFNLPLEELLFFFCIPFACLFTYHCMNLFFKIAWKRKTENIVCITLSLFLISVGLIYYKRLYTSFTCISTGIFLLSFMYIGKIKWFAKFISIYPLLLFPFFIVNGILTGSGLKQPVVWYNNAENTGIRLLTIPLEDVVYGFELILVNIFLYEIFKTKLQNHSENHA